MNTSLPVLLFRGVRQAKAPRRSYTSSLRALQLPQPTVIYANNHLLVVKKPAGWHSIPLDNNKNSKKCLLSWLKRHSLGGGSRKDFLCPIHRLDQPCTGVLLLAKTSKAASRITKIWKRHQVTKIYTCVLFSESHLDALKRHSQQMDDDGWFELKGSMKRSRKQGSITMIPLPFASNEISGIPHSKEDSRVCIVKWKTGERSIGSSNPIIVVKTNEGARHMVRSLLAKVGHAPICGDLRYGASLPLPDQSVALHASKVILPDSLVLPLGQKEFVAPLPVEWQSWFKIRDT